MAEKDALAIDRQVSEGDMLTKTVGDVSIKDLVPFCGVCCFIMSCFTEIPDCFGSVCESAFMCCKSNIILCKVGKDFSKELCKCFATECSIIKCSVCCKVSFIRI